MSTDSILKQYSEARVALVQGALTRAAAIIIGRRRVLSGIRWSGDLIVTAAEAVGGADHVDIGLEGDEVGAEVIATDLATDVAVLRIAATDSRGALQAPGDTRTFLGEGELRSTSPLRIGEAVVVVGRTLRGPFAIGASVQLAGPAWSSRRGGRIDQRIELDVTYDPSLEGGAVIDMEGNVAAMLVPGPYHRVLGIPAATIDAVVEKVSHFGRLPRPYIGIRLQPLWLDDHTRTRLGHKSRGIAAVAGVDAGSPAAEAHIELGDLLVKVDGEPAESANGVAQRIAAINPGQTIALEVLRGGKPLTINVQVGERPNP